MMLRGRKDRLHNLFVRGDQHRTGIGPLLMQHFEQECLRLSSQKITLASSLAYSMETHTFQGPDSLFSGYAR
jgi:GNAT superfamily N-acetyltransferase